MQFLANGGINPETARDYLRAGAMCVGASGWLTGTGDWPLEKIRDRAKQLIDAVEEGRSGQPRRITA
jgi:2-keto-3-deoxy-6-phosphogluconate aldolase